MLDAQEVQCHAWFHQSDEPSKAMTSSTSAAKVLNRTASSVIPLTRPFAPRRASRHPPGAAASYASAAPAPRRTSAALTAALAGDHRSMACPPGRSQLLGAAPQCMEWGPSKAPSSDCLSISSAFCVSQAAAPAPWPLPKAQEAECYFTLGRLCAPPTQGSERVRLRSALPCYL